MPVSVASTTRAPAFSICGKLIAICFSRAAALGLGGPQLGASGRRSMVARIVLITESGSACSKNGSALQTSVGSPRPITVAQYGFFSRTSARYSSSSGSRCTMCTSTSVPALTANFWSASSMAWVCSIICCLCASSRMAR